MTRIEIDDTHDYTLREIRAMVLKHYAENPTHGGDCACLDSIVRIVRKQLNPLAFNYTELNRLFKENKPHWVGNNAVHGVFIHAFRS